jgi:hypothetical protein
MIKLASHTRIQPAAASTRQGKHMVGWPDACPFKLFTALSAQTYLIMCLLACKFGASKILDKGCQARLCAAKQLPSKSRHTAASLASKQHTPHALFAAVI